MSPYLTTFMTSKHPANIFFHYVFNWRIVALQCCVGFCHTTTCISHKYTYIPSLLNLPSIPYPSHPSRLSQNTRLSSVMQQIHTSYLFDLWQCICFNVTLSICPIFSLSRCVLFSTSVSPCQGWSVSSWDTLTSHHITHHVRN